MANLLKKTEDFLNQEFKIVEERFQEKVNINDKLDQIQISNITFSTFQRRIANLIIEDIFIKENPGCSLSQFISQAWRSAKPKNSVTVKTSKNLEAIHADNSPPFILSNMSIAEDFFKPKTHTADQDLDLSEIKVADGSMLSSSTRKTNFDHVIQELRKNSIDNQDLPIIQVTKPEDLQNNFPTNIRKNERKPTGPSLKLLNQANYLVINEANESERSESNQDISSQTLNFTSTGSALRPFSPNMASITGLGSYIKKASESDSSEDDNQRTSIFSMLNAKIVPRTFENSKQSKLIEYKKQNKKTSSSSSDDWQEQAFDNDESSEIFKDSTEISPWFTLNITSKECKFKKIFKKFSGKGEIVKLANLDDLFLRVLKKLKIFPYDHYRALFKNLHQGLYPGKYLKISKRIIDPRLNFVEFVELMNIWGDKYQKERKTFLGKLIKTADRLRHVLDTLGEFEELFDVVSFSLFKLNKMITDLAALRKPDEIEEKYKKTLEEIFLFYAKLQRIQGAEPTFGSVEVSNSTWNLGKFLKFCSDFELIIKKTEGVRATSKENLVCIFKKTAVNTRSMSFQQFIQALDKISEFLYSPDFDRQLLSNFAYKSLPEKRSLLFEAMEIIDFQKIKQKIKPFGIGFNPDKKSRIPRTDPSNKYRFQIRPRQKLELENYQSTQKMLSLSPALDKQKLFSPQPIKKNNHLFAIEGYSNKFKSPTRINRFESAQNINDLDSGGNKLDYIQKNEFLPKHLSLKQFSHEISNPLSVRKSPEVITERLTIKSLYHLKCKDIEEDYSFKDLIMNDSYEEFDKLYSLGPALDKVLKIHDNQRARGLKVIKKNKYR